MKSVLYKIFLKKLTAISYNFFNDKIYKYFKKKIQNKIVKKYEFFRCEFDNLTF